MNAYLKLLSFVVTVFISMKVTAQSHEHHHKSDVSDDHSSIGVMGDHQHKTGGWMVSYRYMNMEMEGNLNDDKSISPEEIVSTLASPFSGPANVRVVPVKMNTTMHMLGLMYAPSNEITLMAMFNYVEKEMDHITFQGMMGTNRLGAFTSESKGIGDTKVSAIYRLLDSGNHHFKANFGLSLPTGNIKEKGQVLTPMNTKITVRLPYAMQLGSGTYDLEPGITYTGRQGKYAWGSQLKAALRLGDNSEDYRLGNSYQLSTWSSYHFDPSISSSLRLTAKTIGDIKGQDDQISTPVQTANPDNYGGNFVNLGFGLNWLGQNSFLRGHQIELEYNLPVIQKVKGVQMDKESMLMFGYRYAF